MSYLQFGELPLDFNVSRQIEDKTTKTTNKTLHNIKNNIFLNSGSTSEDKDLITPLADRLFIKSKVFL